MCGIYSDPHKAEGNGVHRVNHLPLVCGHLRFVGHVSLSTNIRIVYYYL